MCIFWKENKIEAKETDHEAVIQSKRLHDPLLGCEPPFGSAFSLLPNALLDGEKLYFFKKNVSMKLSRRMRGKCIFGVCRGNYKKKNCWKKATLKTQMKAAQQSASWRSPRQRNWLLRGNKLSSFLSNLLSAAVREWASAAVKKKKKKTPTRKTTEAEPNSKVGDEWTQLNEGHVTLCALIVGEQQSSFCPNQNLATRISGSAASFRAGLWGGGVFLCNSGFYCITLMRFCSSEGPRLCCCRSGVRVEFCGICDLVICSVFAVSSQVAAATPFRTAVGASAKRSRASANTDAIIFPFETKK